MDDITDTALAWTRSYRDFMQCATRRTADRLSEASERLCSLVAAQPPRAYGPVAQELYWASRKIERLESRLSRLVDALGASGYSEALRVAERSRGADGTKAV